MRCAKYLYPTFQLVGFGCQSTAPNNKKEVCVILRGGRTPLISSSKYPLLLPVTQYDGMIRKAVFGVRQTSLHTLLPAYTSHGI